MDIRPITPDYAVSPQIAPADVAEIARRGYRTLVCNRPDAEVPAELRAAAIAQAAAAAGLAFVENPVTHQTMTPARLEAQARAMAAAGPVLAYCASGTRCSVLWALLQAGRMPADDILAAAARAGYDLSALRPRLGEGRPDC